MNEEYERGYQDGMKEGLREGYRGGIMNALLTVSVVSLLMILASSCPSKKSSSEKPAITQTQDAEQQRTKEGLPLILDNKTER